MKIRLPWGESGIELALPRTWRVIAHAQPMSVAACVSVEEEFLRAMKEPFGTAPLSDRALRGKRIVIVVDDLTRPTPAHLFFPYFLRELERAGAEASNILLLTALGVHRAMGEEELRKKVGAEALGRLRWENHDARDPSRLAELGVTRAGTRVLVNRRLTEADLIISVGSIEPHVLAGFGGGLKNLVPGCAGVETIGANHLCGSSGAELAQIGADPDANPLRRDLEEAAGKIPAEVFIINAVLNPRKEIVRLFAGDAKLAHREGIRLAREIYGVEVPEPADVLITDSSPMDTDLRQGAKCIGNTLAAVKDQGLILAFLRCSEGVGDFKISGRRIPWPITRAVVRAMGKDGVVRFLDRFRRDLEVEEKFLAVYSIRMLLRNQVLAYAPALETPSGRRAVMFPLVSDLRKLVLRAYRRVPLDATVAIFPQGGVTFPVLPKDRIATS
jgi:lactate racemase